MALSEKSSKLMQALMEAEKSRRRSNLSSDLYQAALLARGESPIEAQMKAAQLQQQATGLDDETRFKRSQALMKPLGGISEKKIAEYGKMLKNAGDAQRRATEKYFDVLKGVAAARSGPAAARIRGEVQAAQADLTDIDKMLDAGGKKSRDTNDIAKNIIRATNAEVSLGGAREGDDFGSVVNLKLSKILAANAKAKSEGRAPVLGPGQTRHLVAALRPSMEKSLTPDHESMYAAKIEEDEGVEDIEALKLRKQQILQGLPNRFRRHGVGGSGIIKKAEGELQKASDNYQQAIVKFRTDIPPDALFGMTSYEKIALPQLKALRDAPSKALPSVHLGRQLMEQADIQEATGGDPTNLTSLMQNFQQSQIRSKRLPFFDRKRKKKLPAPPSAVYGAERQVALEEKEVGDGDTAEPVLNG